MASIAVKQLHKSFQVGAQTVPVLRGIDFSVKSGEFAVVFGPSGSGKSTLLHTILGLEPPTQGTVSLLDTDIYSLKDEDARTEFRKQHIGMVYQQSNWVKSINVIENVALPLLLLGEPKEVRSKKAMEALDMLHMNDWAYHHPSELSSGQQQRVSLARALITDPEIIIADEPTGNLDYESGLELMELLKRFSEKLNKTVVMVTHDLAYLKYADKAVKVIDGEVVKDVDEKKVLSKYKELTLE